MIFQRLTSALNQMMQGQTMMITLFFFVVNIFNFLSVICYILENVNKHIKPKLLMLRQKIAPEKTSTFNLVAALTIKKRRFAD